MDPTELEDALRSRTHARTSLAPGPMAKWGLAMLLFVVMSMLAHYAGLRRGSPNSGPLAVLLTVGLVLSMFIPGWFIRGARVRRLAALALPLDRVSYLDALNVAAPRGALVIDVRLAGDAVVPADQVRADGVVHTEAGLVRITSPTRTTQEFGSYGVYPTNAPLHRWFLTLYEAVLIPLSRTNAIASITARHVAPDA